MVDYNVYLKDRPYSIGSYIKIFYTTILKIERWHIDDIQVKNETYALWTWHRNQDTYNSKGDEIYIVR